MKVSVVIPTYNHRDYILAALESVWAQTFGDYEIIVVNDGSPDDTLALLKPLANAGRIRLLDQPNAGQAAARNRGIAEAGGEYVALLDDDDLWPPDKLEWQVKVLDETPAATMAYGSFRLLRGQTLEPHEPVARPTGCVHRAFRQQCWIMSPGQTLIRLSALRGIGGFDTGIWGSDDWDAYIRLAERHEVVYQDHVALHYRVHAGNASRRALQHAQNHLKVVRRHIGFNLPLLFSHQRAAARFFVPRLRDCAHEARMAGRYGEAARSQFLALAFQPSLVMGREWAVPFVRNVLRMPPRRPLSDQGEPKKVGA